MPLVINFSSNFFRYKQTPTAHSGHSLHGMRASYVIPLKCNLYFENCPGWKTSGSMMLCDDIMGQLRRSNGAVQRHYSVARG